jgi:hypothetical protein
VVRDDRPLFLVVRVEPVALFGEPGDDGLDVLPRPHGHLVADGLRFLEDVWFPDARSKLTKLMPHLGALAGEVAVEPSRRAHVDDPGIPCTVVVMPLEGALRVPFSRTAPAGDG